MKRKNLTCEALERTIEEETAERQRETGDVNPTVLMNMADYRSMLESNLTYQTMTRITPLRAVVSAINSPIGYLLITSGIAAYLAGN